MHAYACAFEFQNISWPGQLATQWCHRLIELPYLCLDAFSFTYSVTVRAWPTRESMTLSDAERTTVPLSLQQLGTCTVRCIRTYVRLVPPKQISLSSSKSFTTMSNENIVYIGVGRIRDQGILASSFDKLSNSEKNEVWSSNFTRVIHMSSVCMTSFNTCRLRPRFQVTSLSQRTASLQVSPSIPGPSAPRVC
jgi:hypothetical protein